MSEDRRPIKGYEGAYEIDRQGNVYSLSRMIDVDDHGRRYRKLVEGRKLKPVQDSIGYLSVRIRDNDGVQKTKRIHRLVAEAFIPNPEGHGYVNHKDEDKTNNNVDNLEWCSNEYNLSYGEAQQRRSASLHKYYSTHTPNWGEVPPRPKGKRVWARERGSREWNEYGTIGEAMKATHCAQKTIIRSCRGENTKRYEFSFEKPEE